MQNDVLPNRNQVTIAAAYERFLKAFGTLLTHNGAEFTDRFGAVRWNTSKTGTGRHAFHKACTAYDITRKLTRPFSPQTNGMAKHFNRRLAEAIRSQPVTGTNGGKIRLGSQAERQAFILKTVQDYKRTRLKCLGYKAPLEYLINQT